MLCFITSEVYELIKVNIEEKFDLFFYANDLDILGFFNKWPNYSPNSRYKFPKHHR